MGLGWRWKETAKRKARTLGPVSDMTRAQAQTELAAIVTPTNGGSAQQQIGFTDFVQGVYLPFYRGKWKRSAAATNEDRLKHHLSFGARSLISFTRDGLQAFLDQKAGKVAVLYARCSGAVDCKACSACRDAF